MTTSREHGIVPEWTRGDRLKKARARTGLSAEAFAQLIGVSEKTINNAEGDKVAVRPITLNAWALATGVDREWLEFGTGPQSGPSGPGGEPKPGVAQLVQRKRSRHAGVEDKRRYLDVA